MSNKELHALLKLIDSLELSEFKMKEGEFSLSVRTKHYVPTSSGHHAPIVAPMPAMSAPTTIAVPATSTPNATAEAAATENTEDESKYLAVKSPMVGTFYRSPSPDKPIYVKVGDSISSGDTVCIIEAMKLFNEVETEVSGKIVKVLVEDAQPVEYDQVLFLVDPNA